MKISVIAKCASGHRWTVSSSPADERSSAFAVAMTVSAVNLMCPQCASPAVGHLNCRLEEITSPAHSDLVLSDIPSVEEIDAQAIETPEPPKFNSLHRRGAWNRITSSISSLLFDEGWIIGVLFALGVGLYCAVFKIYDIVNFNPLHLSNCGNEWRVNGAYVETFKNAVDVQIGSQGEVYLDRNYFMTSWKAIEIYKCVTDRTRDERLAPLIEEVKK